MRFDGKSMIITSGGGKLAEAYALAFAKEGAGLSLLDIARADMMVTTIRNSGLWQSAWLAMCQARPA